MLEGANSPHPTAFGRHLRTPLEAGHTPLVAGY